MTDNAPKVIAGRYEIISQIGSGGMSVVYKAFDKTLHNDVALKMVLHPEAITAEQLRRFQSEAKIASNLRHENLIRVLDFGITHANEPFLVMDFVVGTTLGDYIENNGPIPFSRALPIFVQILNGLEQAHNQNVLHRDLKSANIMLLNPDSSRPHVVILDFGLAKVVEKGDSTITRPGVSIGTPYYMSPEHARGTALDARSDIYSLGCIMFETLCGSLPFNNEVVVETIMQQISETPPAMNERFPDGEFSPQLERIVATALEKDPDNRYQSIADLRDALLALDEASTSRAMSLEEAPPRPVLELSGQASGAYWKLILPVVALLGLVSWAVAANILTHKEEEIPKVEIVDAKADTPLFNNWDSWPWEDDYTWYKRFGIGDEDLKREREKLRKYRYVSLWHENITSKGLRYIEDLPLKGLYLKQTDIEPEALQILGGMKTLEALNLDDLPQLQDKDLKPLTSLPNLKLLSLRRDNITDEALKIIGEIKSLEILNLDKTKVKGPGLEYLKGLTHLRKLRLPNTAMSSKYMHFLANFRNLEELNLHETRIDEASLQYITRLPLKVLDVSKTDVKDSGLEKLSFIPTLRALFAEESKEHGVSLDKLNRIARTRRITVVNGRYMEKSKRKQMY